MRAEGGGLRAEGVNTKKTERSPGSSFIPHPSSLAGFLGMIAVVGLVHPVWPQIAIDPTKPPSGFAVGDPEMAGEGGGGGPVLQSVLISASGRAAIINGEMVKLGQKYGDAVLIRVAENEVALKSGDSTQVLKLYPGVEKRDIAPPAAKAAPRRGKGRKSPDSAEGARTR